MKNPEGPRRLEPTHQEARPHTSCVTLATLLCFYRTSGTTPNPATAQGG